MSNPAIRMLAVEDNEDDVFILRRSISKSDYLVELDHVSNGQDCMKYLRSEGQYAAAKHPDLILLDINMPVMDGKETLAALVQDENLRHIPVVILTTSESEREVLQLHRLRCSSYITKPVDFNEFHSMVQQFLSYWFSLVQLPVNASLGTSPKTR